MRSVLDTNVLVRANAKAKGPGSKDEVTTGRESEGPPADAGYPPVAYVKRKTTAQ